MKKALLYVGICISLGIQAQTRDSIAHIPEVEIIESRFEDFQTGFKKTTIDSAIILQSNAQSLADLLSFNTPIHIKNYGPANIATASFRGTGAQHTAILWNGFNIQQPMLGQFDFSLFPNLAVDAIEIQHGGNGALFGSGAIGGTIILKQLPKWNDGLVSNFTLTAGSFGRLQQTVALAYSNKSYSGKLMVSHQESKNDFEYYSNTNLPRKKSRLTNANLKQYFVTTDHYWKYKLRHTFAIHGWYHLSNRQIAPSLNEATSNAFQDDKALRIAADWNYKTNQEYLTIRTGLFYDVLNYSDINKSTYAKSNSQNWIAEIEYAKKWGRYIKSNTGINFTSTHATADGYQNKIAQQRTALFYALKFNKNKWTVQQSTRIETVDKTVTPIMPSAGVLYEWNKKLHLTANFSRSFRVPTLNERFWQPGGNPNLLPEDGWGGEVGTKYTSEIWHIKWEYQATFFTRNNFNQVVWLMGNGFPQPVNMKHILTSGTEQSIKLEYPIHHKWKIASNHAINTTEAINKRKVSPNDASENKYLIYTPRISQQHQVSIKYASHSLSYQHAYNGMRYTTSDNTDWLDNYAIGNIFLLIGYPIRQVKTTFQFGINNIWNTNYVVVADRPMPGRNYQLTLTFKI